MCAGTHTKNPAADSATGQANPTGEPYMDAMDLTVIPGSRIVEVARLAFTTPDVDFLCFGESDQPTPASVSHAAVHALADGETRYPDVRGLAALRSALAGYLTALHARSVAE